MYLGNSIPGFIAARHLKSRGCCCPMTHIPLLDTGGMNNVFALESRPIMMPHIRSRPEESSMLMPSPRASTSSNSGYAPSTRSTSSRSSRGNGEMKEFHYDVKTRKGKSFAVLTLVAERLFSKHMPTVLQDKNVEGRVHLNLENPEVIRSVVIYVRTEAFFACTLNPKILKPVFSVFRCKGNT